MKRIALLAALAIIAAACGGGSTTTSSTEAPATTVSVATTLATTTTGPPTATSTTASPVAAEPLAIPRLDSGLPATFVAVTEDWEAVEVDTATGEVVRSIGRGETPVESEEDGMVASAIQQAWRTSDQTWFIISQCCEPAAGMIYYLKPGEMFSPEDALGGPSSFAWTVTPSPFDERVVESGYYIEVGPATGESLVSLPLDQSGDLGFASGVAAWDRTGTRISWVSNSWAPDGGATLVHLDLEDLDAAPQEIDITWLQPGQWIDGIGTQASGNLVAFLNTPDPSEESSTTIATEGVVFDRDGELIATFDVETGSAWGGYEPSGRMLIYTDADNTVRWQGLGQSGSLAEGFIHASW